MSMTVEAYFFKGNGRVPNSRLPLLVYRQVIQWSTAEMEDRQRTNYWNPSWHNSTGFYPQHHFHSQSHELISATRGEVLGLFGGHDGKEVLLRKGDVAAIPAGVGHFGVSITDDLLITGSFPSGFGVLDFRLGYPDEYYELAETSRRVPIPAFDPFFGLQGPLPTLWGDADGGKPVPDVISI